MHRLNMPIILLSPSVSSKVYLSKNPIIPDNYYPACPLELSVLTDHSSLRGNCHTHINAHTHLFAYYCVVWTKRHPAAFRILLMQHKLNISAHLSIFFPHSTVKLVDIICLHWIEFFFFFLSMLWFVDVVSSEFFYSFYLFIFRGLILLFYTVIKTNRGRSRYFFLIYLESSRVHRRRKPTGNDNDKTLGLIN